MALCNLSRSAENILKQLAENAKRAEMEAGAASEYEEKYLAEIAAKRWAGEKKAAGIPPRYMESSFEEIEKRGVPKTCLSLYAAAFNYAEHFKETKVGGKGLIFAGAAGRMKTTLAVAVMQRVMKDGGTAYFISMPELLDRLFTMAKNGDPEERQRFESKIRTTQLLVLDDFGAEYPSGWVLNKVDAVVSHRYNYLLPTILTTNMTPEEMKGHYVARVVDRLRSAYDMVIAEGGSLRESGKVLK